MKLSQMEEKGLLLSDVQHRPTEHIRLKVEERIHCWGLGLHSYLPKSRTPYKADLHILMSVIPFRVREA